MRSLILFSLGTSERVTMLKNSFDCSMTSAQIFLESKTHQEIP